MKSKKITGISVISVIIFSLTFGVIYFRTHYAVIHDKVYKNDVKVIHHLHLDNDKNIKEINKCTEIEELFITSATKNSISKLRNFHNLNNFSLTFSDISSLDSEKISNFDNLKNFYTYCTNIDLKGFSNDSVSHIVLGCGEIANLESLSECLSLKKLIIWNLTVSNNCIVVEDNKYVMKDSSIFSSFDYVEELWLSIDKIEDISGILEMDSLKEFKVNEEAISEDDKKLLEDKGISVIYYDE